MVEALQLNTKYERLDPTDLHRAVWVGAHELSRAALDNCDDKVLEVGQKLAELAQPFLGKRLSIPASGTVLPESDGDYEVLRYGGMIRSVRGTLVGVDIINVKTYTDFGRRHLSVPTIGFFLQAAFDPQSRSGVVPIERNSSSLYRAFNSQTYLDIFPKKLMGLDTRCIRPVVKSFDIT